MKKRYLMTSSPLPPASLLSSAQALIKTVNLTKDDIIHRDGGDCVAQVLLE